MTVVSQPRRELAGQHTGAPNKKKAALRGTQLTAGNAAGGDVQSGCARLQPRQSTVWSRASYDDVCLRNNRLHDTTLLHCHSQDALVHVPPHKHSDALVAIPNQCPQPNCLRCPRGAQSEALNSKCSGWNSPKHLVRPPKTCHRDRSPQGSRLTGKAPAGRG